MSEFSAAKREKRPSIGKNAARTKETWRKLPNGGAKAEARSKTRNIWKKTRVLLKRGELEKGNALANTSREVKKPFLATEKGCNGNVKKKGRR